MHYQKVLSGATKEVLTKTKQFIGDSFGRGNLHDLDHKQTTCVGRTLCYRPAYLNDLDLDCLDLLGEPSSLQQPIKMTLIICKKKMYIRLGSGAARLLT